VTVDLAAGVTGEGVPLVLLHAFPLSSAMWEPQTVALAAVARVVTPDQCGFGDSPPVPGTRAHAPSLDDAADDVAALLDRLGLHEVVLGGLSMGGYVAMAFLRRHPGRVRGLLLADTKAGADPPAARDNRLRIADRLDTEGTADVLVEEVLPGLTGPTTAAERPAVVARIRGMVEAAPPAAAAWAQRAMAARPESLDVLRGTDVPAAVVRGDEDGLAGPADVAAMVEALPQGRLELLPGAGHLTSLEVPAEFERVVRELLARVELAG
jgi:pimeloyl-ACP methyl ester carboxylesterase